MKNLCAMVDDLLYTKPMVDDFIITYKNNGFLQEFTVHLCKNLLFIIRKLAFSRLSRQTRGKPWLKHVQIPVKTRVFPGKSHGRIFGAKTKPPQSLGTAGTPGR